MDQQDPILQGKYPAKAHCAKVADYLRSKTKVSTNAAIYLEGQKTILIEDNDEPRPFRYLLPHLNDIECRLSDCALVNGVRFSISAAAVFLTAISSTNCPPPPSRSSSQTSIPTLSYGPVSL